MEEKNNSSIVKLITLRPKDMDIIFKINDILGDQSVSTAIRYALRDWERKQDSDNKAQPTS